MMEIIDNKLSVIDTDSERYWAVDWKTGMFSAIQDLPCAQEETTTTGTV